MARNFKRPHKLVLRLATERYRYGDALAIFGAGVAVNNVWWGLGITAVAAMINTALNLTMRSYR